MTVRSSIAQVRQYLSQLGATASGSSVVTGDLAVSGNVAVATNKFTVTGASGNTLVAGTLGVTGATALASTLSALATSVTSLATSGVATLASAVITAGATIGTTLGVTGVTTLTGGIAASVGFGGAHNALPATATSGTDTTPADGTQYVSSIWIPANITLTGVKYLVGSVGGTNKVYAVLYSKTGAVLANTSITGGGATVGTAAQLQTMAFSPGTYAAVGPALHFVGVSINGATARIRTVPAYCGGSIMSGTVSQTQGTSPTVAAITPPTAFAADTAPFLSVY
jgi:hypothetical protein